MLNKNMKYILLLLLLFSCKEEITYDGPMSITSTVIINNVTDTKEFDKVHQITLISDSKEEPILKYSDNGDIVIESVTVFYKSQNRNVNYVKITIKSNQGSKIIEPKIDKESTNLIPFHANDKIEESQEGYFIKLLQIKSDEMKKWIKLKIE